MQKRKDKWGTLESILSESFKMIQKGVNNYKNPYHFPILGTVIDGKCNLRTVILRQFNETERMLVCHTDKRAPKVLEISKNQNISWLFYHPKKQVQLRIRGIGELHNDDPFADEKWSETRLTSRLNYCSELPPGTSIDNPSSGLPDLLLNKIPTLINTEKGRANFTTISCRFESMDWLRLNVLGNRRANFNWNKTEINATWVIP